MTPFEHAKQHTFVVQEHQDLGTIHDHLPLRFKIEEPAFETHTQTFHGREPGYVYRDHLVDKHVAPEDRHMVTHFVEPVYEGLSPYDHGRGYPDSYHGHHQRFEQPLHHPREVDFQMDRVGHVHMYERVPDILHSFNN